MSWWKAENNAQDSIGTSHGTAQNGAGYVAGKVGQAFSFNGAHQYVSVPDSTFWNLGISFSIEFWARFTSFSPSSAYAFIAHDDGGGTKNKWIFWLNGGNLQLHLNSVSNGSQVIGTIPFSPTINTWYHIALTKNGSTYTIYVNGNVLSEATSIQAIPATSTGPPLTLGQAEGGYNLNGSLDEVSIYNRALSDSEIQAIYNAGAAGTSLDTAQTVRAWGYNQYGQLGNNSTTDSHLPVPVSGLTEVTAVASGLYHSMALKSDGSVWAWGYNLSGQLGNNSTTDSHVPVPVKLSDGTPLSGVIAIASGDNHSLALKSDGSAWAWGNNPYGQLGNNSTTDSHVPVPISSLTGVAAIAAGGGTHSMALKSDGSVWSWGLNSRGELGNNSTANSSVPVAVPGLGAGTGVTAIAAGSSHSMALKSDGSVWAWGYNQYGQLGNNSTTDSHVPVPVSGLAGVTAIACGPYHSLALKSDGSVWAWGYNLSGLLGNNSTTESHVPVPVSGLAGVISIAVGNGLVWRSRAMAVRGLGATTPMGS